MLKTSPPHISTIIPTIPHKKLKSKKYNLLIFFKNHLELNLNIITIEINITNAIVPIHSFWPSSSIKEISILWFPTPVQKPAAKIIPTEHKKILFFSI
jgi:hypothetical protein